MEGLWSEAEQAGLGQALAMAVIGGPDTVAHRLEEIIAQTGADEIMMTSQVYDHAARLHSYEIVAGMPGLMEKTGP
jgi:alkanesulfonate monooxygenase SsuD/methylene tetrahydromethanopterin reductase-like flavin-dependent oxidoreductase (luciferase family)